jgi:hypothetical protein
MSRNNDENELGGRAAKAIRNENKDGGRARGAAIRGRVVSGSLKKGADGGSGRTQRQLGYVRDK